MAMVRFDPFRDRAVLQDRMNRLFNDAYSPRQSDDLTSRGTWTPAVDIYEVNGGLVLKAELPDMTREDIDVSVENNTLTLSGERKVDTEVRKEHYHRLERSFGNFSRSFALPATVDTGKIGADFKNGVPGLWSPEELLIASVATCFELTMIAVAEYRGVPLHALRVDATGHVERKSHLYRLILLELEVHVETDPGHERELEHIAVIAREGCLVGNALDVPIRLEVSTETTAAAAAAG